MLGEFDDLIEIEAETRGDAWERENAAAAAAAAGRSGKGGGASTSSGEEADPSNPSRSWRGINAICKRVDRFPRRSDWTGRANAAVGSWRRARGIR